MEGTKPLLYIVPYLYSVMLAELTAKAAKLLTKPYFQVVVTLTNLCRLAEISTLWIFVWFFEQNFLLSFYESHAGFPILKL